MSISQLPQSTIKLLSSSQVITSVSSAVKELVENSLDAGASSIEVKLDNNGLDRIEVKDNGSGINLSNAVVVGLPHTTSKISVFSDIELLETYGFRGEALNALCQVGNVIITTATEEDTTGMIYVLDKNGQVTSSKPTHKSKGTSIVVQNLFKNIPVRRQFYSNIKRAKEELRRVENIVKSLGVINPHVRFTLSHNKCVIWQKTSVTELRQGVVYMIGYTPARELYELKGENPEVRIEALVPRIGCDINILSKANPDWSMVFINRRPVQLKSVYKVVCDYVTNHFGEKLLQRKSPIFVVSFTLSPKQLDVNLEPNKTRVLVRNEEDVLEELRRLLTGYYGDPPSTGETGNVESTAKKRKLESPQKTAQSGKSLDVLSENQLDNCVKRSPVKVETFSADSVQAGQSGEQRNPQGDFSTVRRTLVHEKENVVDVKNPVEKDSNKLFTIKTLDLDQSMTVEKWSMGHVKDPTENGNFIQGPVVFVTGPESAPPVREKLQLPLVSTSSTNDSNIEEERRPVVRAFQDRADPVQNLSSEEMQEFEKDWSLSDRAGFARLDSPPPAVNCSERLGPVISPPRPRNEKNRRKPLQLIPRDGEIDMSVSSQMGRREFAGFTKFARDVRPQIILENPGIAFTKVAVMLSDKWKGLPSSDREKYEEKARDHLATRKVQHGEDFSQPKLSFEPKEKLSVQKEKPATNSSKPAKSVNLNRSQTGYRISRDIIKERSQTIKMKKTESTEGDCVPIGRLQPSGGWVCLRGGRDLSLITPCRLQEIVLTHRLLATYTIPLRPLSRPQRLDEKDVGADNWRLLLSMNRTICDLDGATEVVSSPIIAKNGFRIQLSKSEGNTVVTLTHVADTISFYSIQDLVETLLLASTNGTDDLSSCRPLRVVNHIKGEAVRICRQDPSIMERHVLEELLLYWKLYLAPTELCLHSKPIFTQIHSIALC